MHTINNSASFKTKNRSRDLRGTLKPFNTTLNHKGRHDDSYRGRGRCMLLWSALQFCLHLCLNVDMHRNGFLFSLLSLCSLLARTRVCSRTAIQTRRSECQSTHLCPWSPVCYEKPMHVLTKHGQLILQLRRFRHWFNWREMQRENGCCSQHAEQTESEGLESRGRGLRGL